MKGASGGATRRGGPAKKAPRLAGGAGARSRRPAGLLVPRPRLRAGGVSGADPGQRGAQERPHPPRRTAGTPRPTPPAVPSSTPPTRPLCRSGAGSGVCGVLEPGRRSTSLARDFGPQARAGGGRSRSPTAQWPYVGAPLQCLGCAGGLVGASAAPLSPSPTCLGCVPCKARQMRSESRRQSTPTSTQSFSTQENRGLQRTQ